MEVAAEPQILFDLTQDYSRRLSWDPYLKVARLVGGAERAGLGVRDLRVGRATGSAWRPATSASGPRPRFLRRHDDRGGRGSSGRSQGRGGSTASGRAGPGLRSRTTSLGVPGSSLESWAGFSPVILVDAWPPLSGRWSGRGIGQVSVIGWSTELAKSTCDILGKARLRPGRLGSGPDCRKGTGRWAARPEFRYPAQRVLILKYRRQNRAMSSTFRMDFLSNGCRTPKVITSRLVEPGRCFVSMHDRLQSFLDRQQVPTLDVPDYSPTYGLIFVLLLLDLPQQGQELLPAIFGRVVQEGLHLLDGTVRQRTITLFLVAFFLS